MASPSVALRPLAAASLAMMLAGSPPVSGAAPPAATRFHCPGHLLQQPVADGLPQGWVVHAPTGELPLQRAAFYAGDPVGLGALAPDATRRSGLVETSTWRFTGEGSEGVWLGCLYRDAAAVVARPLPAGLRQCTTVLRLTSLGDPSEPLSVECL